MRTLRRAISVGLFLGLAVGTARAFPNEPNGFGPVRFGMSPQAVAKLFPALKSKGKEEFLEVFDLDNQSMLGLKPCSLELRFVDERLYEISFRCEPKDQVQAALEKQFGEPTQTRPDGVVWFSAARRVAFNPASKGFTLADRSLGKIAQQKLLGYVLRHQGRAQATRAAAPPTP